MTQVEDLVEKGKAFMLMKCTWHSSTINQIIDNVNEVNKIVRVRVNDTDFAVCDQLGEEDILERLK